MPVSPRIVAERQARYDRRMAAAEQVIPEGLYCYTVTGPMREVKVDGETKLVLPTCKCPFWKHHGGKREHENGYCRLLKAGDWMPFSKGGTDLLWDQVKACGINMGDDGDGLEDGESSGRWVTPDELAEIMRQERGDLRSEEMPAA